MDGYDTMGGLDILISLFRLSSLCLCLLINKTNMIQPPVPPQQNIILYFIIFCPPTLAARFSICTSTAAPPASTPTPCPPRCCCVERRFYGFLCLSTPQRLFFILFMAFQAVLYLILAGMRLFSFSLALNFCKFINFLSSGRKLILFPISSQTTRSTTLSYSQWLLHLHL